MWVESSRYTQISYSTGITESYESEENPCYFHQDQLLGSSLFSNFSRLSKSVRSKSYVKEYTSSYEHFFHVKEYVVQLFNLHQDWKKYLKEFQEFQRIMAENNQTIPPPI